jgi:hypothetical protein
MVLFERKGPSGWSYCAAENLDFATYKSFSFVKNLELLLLLIQLSTFGWSP